MGLFNWWRNRGRDFLRYPGDENGDVLWHMARSGDDLSKARRMDFFFVFPTEDLAKQFCGLAQAQGYDASLSYFAEKESWDTECSIELVPTHARVSEVEHSLSTVAKQLGGRADGWGSFAQEAFARG